MSQAIKETRSPEKPKTYRWTILSLVFLATTINYLDRQVISLLKDDYLQPLFGWTELDYANIVIAFQVAYAIGMVAGGWVIDRIGTKMGYALWLTVWSLATVGHALMKTVFGFSVARGVLGLSQAGNFPAAIKTVAEWFPKKERAFAAGIFNSGTNVGAIIAPLLVPLIAMAYGWKWAFIIPGLAGLVWLIFWVLHYQQPADHRGLSQEEYDYIHRDDQVGEDPASPEKVPWLQLLRYKQTWAFAALKFFSDPVWWFLLFWLPSFLNKAYGMSQLELAIPIAVVYLMAMVGSVAGGWLSGHFMSRGWPLYRARRTSLLIFALMALPMVFAQYLGQFNYWYAVAIIGLATSAHQAWSANIFTTVSDMFPKKAVGSVVGIGGMVGSIGGVLVARTAGLLLDHYQALGIIETGYYFMFMFCALAYLVAWGIFSLLVPKMPEVVWS
jgi:ACS family hexuronate transporter-like MFS transporter